MKIFIVYSASLFLAILFLTTTSGFTVYSHYCSGTLVNNKSLIESHANCGQCSEKFEDKEDKDTISSCCNTQSCEKKPVSKDCCSDIKEYFKIQDDYNITSETKSEKCLYAQKIIAVSNIEELDNYSYFKDNILYYSLPPPLSGKQIVLLYHRLKTDPGSSV